MYASLAERHGIEQGIAIGKQEGLKEGLHQTACNMKALGLSFDVISKATGLSETEIRLLD